MDDASPAGGRNQNHRGASSSNKAGPTGVDYESVADAYHRTRTVNSGALATWHHVLDPYFDRWTNTVLDVGAGTGQFATLFTEWFGADVVALEPSSAMRRVAQERTRCSRTHFLAARCEAIPLASASIDRAWLSAVIHHFADLDLALSEIVRVVRPRGLVLIRGFFRDLPLPSVFSTFPGIERSVSAFPSTQEITHALTKKNLRLLEQHDVVENHERLGESWQDRLRQLRSADSLLRPLTDVEFESGITSLRHHASTAAPPRAPRVTLRLLVSQAR